MQPVRRSVHQRQKRAKFREDVVQAFNDMVSAGGLSEWRCEVLGSGRLKTYRYHYTHALPRQGMLALELPAEEAPVLGG